MVKSITAALQDEFSDSITSLYSEFEGRVSEQISDDLFVRGITAATQITGCNLSNLVCLVQELNSEREYVKAAMLVDTIKWLTGINEYREMSPMTWDMLHGVDTHKTFEKVSFNPSDYLGCKAIPRDELISTWCKKTNGFRDMICTMHVLTKSKINCN